MVFLRRKMVYSRRKMVYSWSKDMCSRRKDIYIHRLPNRSDHPPSISSRVVHALRVRSPAAKSYQTAKELSGELVSVV